jgi:hypothetical protein
MAKKKTSKKKTTKKKTASKKFAAKRVRNTNPLQGVFYSGALRSMIVAAISYARHPQMNNERSWCGANCSIQDSCGRRGTIAFAKDGKFVAVFRWDRSDRCPWRTDQPYDIDVFFEGCPPELRALADTECLRYVLDEHDGKVFPVISCAFWGDGQAKQVQSAEPWENMLEHGANIAAVDFLEDKQAYPEYAEYFGLEEPQLELAKQIHQRKLAAGARAPKLTKSEVALIQAIAKNKAAMKTVKESFGEINIQMP